MSQSYDDIAIIGMACIYPGAPDVVTFWRNILSKVDAVSDPPENLGFDDFFDPESSANDRIYCKKGGFIEEFADFNPLEFGIMPGSVDGSSPEQFLALKVAQEALADADYLDRPFNRRQTGIILGHGLAPDRGMGTCLQHGMAIDQMLRLIKQLHPETSKSELQAIRQELKSNLPPLNADTCPGLISNVLTGRIANRLDLQGPNYSVDAACASSLLAVDAGMRELQSHRCDMVIVGGVHATTSHVTVLLFCLLGAISRKGKIRPFDKEADGTLLGEGLGMMVLKRREDAERDGDRVYALIKGVGVASDGRGQGLLVPRKEGQMLALERAYEATGIPLDTIGLIEAHGTGTSVGDATEIETMTCFFGQRKGEFPSCAIGSVKSMISHTIPAAGMAALIKTALALYHKILPPTLCDEPDPKLNFGKTPFYVNSETRPWIHGHSQPRRAGVNAFGFGGINAHAILEEYTKGEGSEEPSSYAKHWDTEVSIIQGESREEVIQKGKQLLRFISANPEVELKDIAYTLNCPVPDEALYRMAVVASSPQDLEKKLDYALKRLADLQCREIKDRSGIFFFEKPIAREGKLAFLFPGEGAQYVNMLLDLCVEFPEVRACFDAVDNLFIERQKKPLLSQVVFPSPHISSEKMTLVEQNLWQLEYAVNAVAAADFGLKILLDKLKIRPHAHLGHSIGNDIALSAAGVVEVQRVGRFLKFDVGSEVLVNNQAPVAKLMTVGACDPSYIASMVTKSDGELYVSMDNCPNQVILCGTESATKNAYELLKKKGAICNFLPYDRAYHTPWFKAESGRDTTGFFERAPIRPPQVDIYSYTTAQLFPRDTDKIRKILVDQWALPIRFRETIEKMYDDGVRIFVEVGPKGNLTGFVEDTLRRRPYVAVPTNLSTRSGITQLNQSIGLLAAHGVPMSLDYLYAYRNSRKLPIYSKSGKGIVKALNGSSKVNPNTGTMKLTLAIPYLTLNRRVRGTSNKNASLQTKIDVANVIHGTSKNNMVAGPQPTSLSQQAHNRDKVMQEYLRNMERFLGQQQAIMRIFLDKKTTHSTNACTSEQNLLCSPWPSAVAQLPNSSRLRSSLCREMDDGIRPDVLANDILSGRERETWLRLPESQRRRREWLAGRLTAKDAVRLLLKDLYQMEACPADIEISANEHGQPAVSGELVAKLGCRLYLSIAHSDEAAVAVVGDCGKGLRGIGIDIERLDRNHKGLEEAGFTADERSLFDDVPASEREEWLLRLWCAKEALAKALGQGMMGNPLNIVVQDVDVGTGRVNLKIAGQLARKLTDYVDGAFTAYTGCDENLVFAISLVQS